MHSSDILSKPAKHKTNFLFPSCFIYQSFTACCQNRNLFLFQSFHHLIYQAKLPLAEYSVRMKLPDFFQTVPRQQPNICFISTGIHRRERNIYDFSIRK